MQTEDDAILDMIEDMTRNDLHNALDVLNTLRSKYLEQPMHLCTSNCIADMSKENIRTLFRAEFPNEGSIECLRTDHMLGLILNKHKVIKYSLPVYSSPLLEKRVFARGDSISPLGGFSTRADINNAVHHWLAGISGISLDSVINSDKCPREPGMYLCYDEHKQVRYGYLFKNAADSFTFSEITDKGTTNWFDGEHLDLDSLPMYLLTNWILVLATESPNVKAVKASTDPIVSESDRIYYFLASLDDSTKQEFEKHFSGLVDRPDVDSVGRKTQDEWAALAQWCADDRKLEQSQTWQDQSAWQCFIAVMDSFSFNMTTKTFE